MQTIQSYLCSLVVVAIFAVPAFGRLLENWPYDRLFKEADLVVIAVAEDTKDTKDRFTAEGWKLELVGQETTFIVRSTLKGKMAREQKLKVLHFRLQKGQLVSNGPLLVIFRSKPLTLNGTINRRVFKAGVAQPDYMLFLRARPDGRYELVSGQFDPALSVRELHPGDGFFSKWASRDE
jgi:hypothetical protein